MKKKETAKIEYTYNNLACFASKAYIKRDYDFSNQTYSFTHKGSTLIGEKIMKKENFKINDFYYIENLLFHIDKDQHMHIFETYQEPNPPKFTNKGSSNLFRYETDFGLAQIVTFHYKDEMEEYMEITKFDSNGVAIHTINNHKKFMKLYRDDFNFEEYNFYHKFSYCHIRRHKAKNNELQQINEKEFLTMAKSILELLPKEKKEKINKVLTKTIE